MYSKSVLKFASLNGNVSPGLKILLNKKTKDEEKPRYIRALDFQSGPEKDAALIKLIGAGS